MSKVTLPKEPVLVNKIIDKDNFQECLEIFLPAFLDEPTCFGLGSKRENFLAFFPRILEEFMYEGVCNVVWDEANQQVAGCGFNEIDFAGKTTGLHNALKWCCDEKIVQLFETFDQVYGEWDAGAICEKYGVDKYIFLQFGATRPEYRNRGVHTLNALGRMELGRKHGCSLVVVNPTSRYSQMVYEKLGFETIAEKPYADLRINGKQLINLDKMGVHKSSKLMAKRL